MRQPEAGGTAQRGRPLERLRTFLNEDVSSKGSLPMEQVTRTLSVHPSVSKEGRPHPTHTAECPTRQRACSDATQTSGGDTSGFHRE